MNTRQYRKLSSCIRIINTKLLETESIVQSGLALTPSQMLNMTEQGRAISPQNLSPDYFTDSDFTGENDFHVNIEEMRGITPNKIWETEQDIKQKFRKMKSEKDSWQQVEGGSHV